MSTFQFPLSLFWMYTNVSGASIYLLYSSFEETPWCTTEELSPRWHTTLTVMATYQMSLVLAPRARSPSVEKKSSISFSSSRLRFSASSRARSEFRSFISSMRCFFLSCSISCSIRSIVAHRAALDSSSLRGRQHITDRKKRSLTFTFNLCAHWERC